MRLIFPGLARCLGLLAFLSYCGVAAAFQLVTESEMVEMHKQLREFREPPMRTRSFAVEQGPKIELISPRDPSANSPLRVEVQFLPLNAKEIDPKSLKVFYGIGPFKKDVTDRVMKNGRLTKEGLVMENVEAPKGTHRFILQISDIDGHIAQREIRIEIV